MLQTALHFTGDFLVFGKSIHVELGEHFFSVQEHFEPSVVVRLELK
jgi:hypothetical protein